MSSDRLHHRITSAPYRLSDESTRRSQYHTKCGTTASQPTPARAMSAGTTLVANYQEFQKNSVVVQDEIWKHSCWNESTREKKWQQSWGFLKDFDQKGNIKEPKELHVEGTSIYSDKLPNTSNGNYGQRLQSQKACFIKRLEQTPHNLRKNKELLYYD